MPKEVAIPEWLAPMIRQAIDEGNWPGGKYPDLAFEARGQVANECGEDSDQQVTFLQLVLNEVERLRAENSQLAAALACREEDE